MASLTAITGGIGSGKSVVSRILSELGYEVYDSDSRAKELMDNSSEIKKALTEAFGEGVVNADGEIDRKLLSSIVFNNGDALKKLNSIVHKAVLDDIMKWCEKYVCYRLFVETAILYQSGLDKLVDEVWEVMAPEEIRIQRVMKRNNVSAEEASRRIESQRIKISTLHPRVFMIENWGNSAVLPQIKALL